MADEPEDLSDVGPVASLSRVLLAALEHTRAATCITTAELDPPGPEIVYVNPAYCAMTGRARHEVIGSTPRVMQGPLTDRRVLDRLRSDLEAGRRFSGETVNYRADGTPFIISWSIDPVVDSAGCTTHYVATQEDVTTRVRAARLLAAERKLDDALTTIVNGQLADAEAICALAREIVGGASALAGVGAPVASVFDDERSASAGDRDTGGATATFAFSRAGSSAHGVVEITGLSADEAVFLDRAGLEVFASHAGAVVAALVEYQRQRRIALQLQLDLLPAAEVAAPGFSVVTRYLPGTEGLHIGGDWYDVAVTDRRLVFSVGDVSGQGVEAAALMGRLRLLADVEIRQGRAVDDVLRVLDGVCAGERQFATMLVIEFERDTELATIRSCGHLPPVAFEATSAELVDIDVAPPLGFVLDRSIGVTQVSLPAGRGLLAFTDGLVERRGEVLDVGLDRVLRALGDNRDLEHLAAAVTAHCDGADDVALLALRREE